MSKSCPRQLHPTDSKAGAECGSGKGKDTKRRNIKSGCSITKVLCPPASSLVSRLRLLHLVIPNQARYQATRPLLIQVSVPYGIFEAISTVFIDAFYRAIMLGAL
jgi:hypothetical protein